MNPTKIKKRITYDAIGGNEKCFQMKGGGKNLTKYHSWKSVQQTALTIIGGKNVKTLYKILILHSSKGWN